MPIEIIFSLSPGTKNAAELKFLKLFQESVKNLSDGSGITFSNPETQALWAKFNASHAVQISVAIPTDDLRELVDKIVIRTTGQVYVTRKRLPELCKALGITEANQTANALTALTKPAHDQRKNRFPNVDLLAVSKSSRDDINLTSLCHVIKQDYFELAYLACETASHIRLEYLQRFARMIVESQVLDGNTKN